MRPEGLDADEELQRRERLWAEVKEKMAVTVPEYQTRAQVDEMNARINGNLEDVLGGEKAQQVSATPEAVQTSPRDDHEVNLDLTRFLAREREAPSDVQITATEEVVEQSPRLHRKVKQDLTSFLEECWREWVDRCPRGICARCRLGIRRDRHRVVWVLDARETVEFAKTCGLRDCASLRDMIGTR